MGVSKKGKGAMCKLLSCVVIIVVAILLFLSQGFYWAFLGLQQGTAEGGLVALYCISAIVMIFVCVCGILAACDVCYPVFLVMWLIACLILMVVIIIQMILNAVLYCTANTGSTQSVVCNNYSAVSWAALGVTLGLATIGFIFGLIFFKVTRDEDEGSSSVKSGSSAGKNDYDY